MRSPGNACWSSRNHTSFLDAALLAVFLPDRLTFAINTEISKRWWIKPLLVMVEAFPLDPTNPYSIKSLIRYIEQDKRAAIFPEGRITVTGSLMKIYPGPGLVADKSGAMLLPVRIDGAQYTPFSRLRGRIRLRWFPRITLTILPPRRFHIPPEVRGRERRRDAGKQLADLMTEMMFATSNYRRTLFGALLDARRVHGGRHSSSRTSSASRSRTTSSSCARRSSAELIATRYAARRIRGRDAAERASPRRHVLRLAGPRPRRRHAELHARRAELGCVVSRARASAASIPRSVSSGARSSSTSSTASARPPTVVYLEDLRAQVTPWLKIKAALASRFAGWRYAASA